MVIDTNVLLRFMLREGNTELYNFFSTAGELIITDYVISEALYVMEGKSYAIARTTATKAIIAVLNMKNVMHLSEVSQKYLNLYLTTGLDLADCYLICLSLKLKKPLKTFDKKMLKVYKQEKATQEYNGFITTGVV